MEVLADRPENKSELKGFEQAEGILSAFFFVAGLRPEVGEAVELEFTGKMTLEESLKLARSAEVAKSRTVARQVAAVTEVAPLAQGHPTYRKPAPQAQPFQPGPMGGPGKLKPPRDGRLKKYFKQQPNGEWIGLCFNCKQWGDHLSKFCTNPPKARPPGMSGNGQ